MGLVWNGRGRLLCQLLLLLLVVVLVMVILLQEGQGWVRVSWGLSYQGV
jgi:hypothetical protein